MPAPAGAASVFSGDFLVIGGGLAVIPDYEGSDSMKAMPVIGVAGRIGGIGISARAGGVSLDLLREAKGAEDGLILGPVLRYRLNRTGRSSDPAVAALGRLPGVIEGGVTIGYNRKHLLNRADSLTLSADIRMDLSGRGSGVIVAPGISYLTPLSRSKVAGLALTADWIDARYARFNFGVDTAGSAASGLPVYRPGGGAKDIGLGAFIAQDLDGDLLNGGFSLGLGAMYSQLLGSAAQSPVTRLRGRRGQWIGGLGLAYVFGTGPR